jgi:cold shock CspA family protein/ribosome-associated translation inhibitor RaiA
MQIPVDVTFKEMTGTESLNMRIQEGVAKLERVYDRITRCEVLIDAPHRHHHKGREFHVRIRLTVPGGGEIVASHDAGSDGAHEDVYVALRDAFNAARRQLEDYVAMHLRRRPDERIEPTHARVSYIDAEREWGFLEPGDGRRVYFHRNSVRGGVDQLALGSEVRFTEEQGDDGPQASTVEIIGSNGRHAVPS